jgi:hypothetical protein
MNAIKAVWKDGRIIPEEPVNWPDGCDLVVEPVASHTARIGIDESEWRDDEAGLSEWSNWLKTIEPLEFTPEEEAANLRFRAQMREHNIEAVRRQMEENCPE